jgi:Loader and inhibitor of phage G40P
MSNGDKLLILKFLEGALPTQNNYGISEKEMKLIVEKWAELLHDLPIENIIFAANEYLKKFPDMPKPSHIRCYARYRKFTEPTGIRIPTQSEIL